MKGKTGIFIKALVSVGFFLLLGSFLKGHELLAVFRNVDWPYLVLSFLLIPVLLVTSCLKWKVLFDAGNYSVSFRKLLTIYLVGYFFSNLLPSTVGGDVVRTYYSGREIDSISFSAVTVFVERFTGVLFLLLLVCVAPFIYPPLYGNLYLIVPALGAFFLLLLIAVVWRMKGTHAKILSLLHWLHGLLKRLEKKSSSRLMHGVVMKLNKLTDRFLIKLDTFRAELGRAMDTLRSDRVFLGKIVILTIGFYFLTWVNVFVAFLAFGCHVDFMAMVALVPPILFVAQMPVTLLGNLGFFESVFVVYFLFIGVPGEQTLAMGLLLRFRLLCLGAVGFLVYLFYRKGRGHFEYTRNPSVSEQNNSTVTNYNE